MPRPSQRHNPEEAASAMIDDLSLEELQSADLHLRLDEPAVSKLKGAHPESMITAELSKQVRDPCLPILYLDFSCVCAVSTGRAAEIDVESKLK